MGAHVFRHMASPREGLTAGRAGAGAVARMGTHVIVQVAGVRAGHVAGGADVGADTGMGARVLLQVAGLREGLAAGGTCVGPDAGMCTHVARQVTGLREGLAASCTLTFELAPRPVSPPLARRSRIPTPSFSGRLFSPLRVSNHRPNQTAFLAISTLSIWPTSHRPQIISEDVLTLL